jgi:hypothetical protein
MIPFDNKSAAFTATQIAKQSDGVSIKRGRTNGHPVLHLVRKATETVEAASVTLRSASEWYGHEWNKTHKRDNHNAEEA